MTGTETPTNPAPPTEGNTNMSIDPNLMLKDMRHAMQSLGRLPIGDPGSTGLLLDYIVAAELLDEHLSTGAGDLPTAWQRPKRWTAVRWLHLVALALILPMVVGAFLIIATALSGAAHADNTAAEDFCAVLDETTGSKMWAVIGIISAMRADGVTVSSDSMHDTFHNITVAQCPEYTAAVDQAFAR